MLYNKQVNERIIDGVWNRKMERVTFPVILIGASIFILLAIVDLVKNKNKSTWNRGLLFSFIFYCVIVSQLTLGTLYIPPIANAPIRIQLEPFYFIQEWRTYTDFESWAFFNNARLTFFNFMMFMPFGFFLVYLFRIKKAWKALLILFASSLLIETLQLIFSYLGLVWMRGFNTDDLIMNSLGGFLVFLFFKIFGKRRGVKKNDKQTTGTSEKRKHY